MLSRHAFFSILLLAVAGLYATWCDTAMIWDGAHQLALSLFTGKPYFYLSRFHSWVLWQPTVWLDHMGASVGVLKAAYALPFCLAPAVSTAMSWWITRRTAPHLFLWAMFGCAIGALPGQIFIINDSIFQVHLYWPVFLAAFLPLTRAQVVAVVLLSLFQLSHPIGIGATALISGCAVALAFHRAERRPALLKWAAWHALLALGGIAKLYLWPDSYAAREATLSQALNTLFAGVLTWPLPGLLAMWTAVFLLAWKLREANAEETARFGRTLAFLLLGTGALWLVWGANPRWWYPAINYRRWVLPVNFPFLAAAYFEIWRGSAPHLMPRREIGILRGRTAVGLATIFLVVLGAQSTTWHSLWRQLDAQVAVHHEPILGPEALAWTKETPLEHWGLYSQVLILQGKKPHTFYLDAPELAAALETPPRVAFSPFVLVQPSTSPTGWFDWNPALQTIRRENGVRTAESQPDLRRATARQ